MPAETVPPILVVDASVGIKWVVEENGSDEAVALIEGHRLIVPALFWIEAANVLAIKVRRGELTMPAANDAWRDLCGAPVETVAVTPQSVSPALVLAHELAHPVYDCCYISLAVASGCSVATADRRLAAAMAGQPTLADRVGLIGG